jgi:hypothetical protein
VTRALLAAGVALTLAASTPAIAQGNSNGHGQGNANGNGGSNHGTPPSRNTLTAPPTAAAPSSSGGGTPLAWIDDATLLDSGAASVGLSAMRWQGAGTSEVDAPVVDGAVGLVQRVQFSASIPRSLGSSSPDGAVGGVGTSFFSSKVAALENHARTFRVAVAPTLELLGGGVAASLGPGESRMRWGLPVSAEFDRGVMRVYGGGGHFSPGVWYGGAAVAIRATPRVGVTVGFSRAWYRTDAAGVPLSARDRKELTGGVSYTANRRISLFGSLARTLATLEANGAGTTLSGGLSLYFAPSGATP